MAIRNALPFEFPFRWNDIRRFFQMPDEAVDYLDQRDRDLEDFLAGLGGDGGTPALFVAASDASDESKAAAHYTCDGTNDEVQINEALEALRLLAVAGGYGSTDNNAPAGRVLLSEGTFNIADEVGSYTNAMPNMTLQGMGMTATRIKTTAAFHAIYSSGFGFRMCDFTLDGSGATSGGYGVYLAQQYASVERVRFRQVGRELRGNLHLAEAHCAVRDCEFISTQNASCGVYLASSNNRSSVTGCWFYEVGLEAVYADASDYHVVTGNIIEGCQNGTTDTEAIVVDTNSVVVGNVCESWGGFPATITSGTGSQVANNVLI